MNSSQIQGGAEMQAKNVRFFRSFALVIGLALLATPVFGQGVAFQASSLPQQARFEGLTETMGAVVLQATAAGTILTGSSITILYSGSIANTPTLSSLSGSFFGIGPCSGAGCTGATGSTATFAVAVSGNQLTLSVTGAAGTIMKFAQNDYIVISQVRVNVNGLGSSVGTVTATMSGTSSAPTSNPITFTQSTVPVASVVNPSLTVAMNANGGVAPVLQTCGVTASTFNVVITERYPAAVTTLLQESAFTPSYAPANGTSIIIALSGVPSGMGVVFSGVNIANSTFSGGTTASFTNAGAALLVGNGSFSFTAVGGLTSASETAQFDFRIGSLNSAQTALSNTSIAALGTTQNITATVSIGLVQSAATATVAFAANTQGTGTVATIGDCVTNLLFPFITNQAGFDTSIQISNTSSDALAFSAGNATKANGVCTLTLYPTDITAQTATAAGTVGTPSQITTANIPSGGAVSFLQSGTSFKNQSGYMIAVCRFLDAHGFSFVTNGPSATATISQGLLALVIPNNSISNGRVNTQATLTCAGQTTTCTGTSSCTITTATSCSVNQPGSSTAANLSYEATSH